VEWAEFEKAIGADNARISEEHITRSPCCTVEKIRRVLGVEMKYTIMDIFKEYLDYQKL
jgi:hypothetical protein